MRITLNVLLLVGCFVGSAVGDETRPSGQGEPSSEQADEVTGRLNAWREVDAEPSGRTLRVVYFYPADGKPAVDHRRRIEATMADIRRFYADGMAKNGYGPLTFNLESNDEAGFVIHEVQGRKKRAEYTRESSSDVMAELGRALGSEGIDLRRETLLVICALLVEDGTRITGHENNPYFGRGGARSGQAFVSDTSLHAIENLSKKEPMITAERGTISLGRYASHQIGGWAHELGHALGLPHDARNAGTQQPGHTLMGGRGNLTYREELRGEGQGTYLSPTSAFRLASHPLFTGSRKHVDRQPKTELVECSASTAGGGVRLSGRLDTSGDIYGVAVYLDKSEARPGSQRSNSDYDAITQAAVVDSQNRFSFSIDPPGPGHYELRLVACHNSGLTNTFRFPLTVDGQGTPQVDNMLLNWKIGRAIAAFAADNADETRRIAAEIADGSAQGSTTAAKMRHLVDLLDMPKSFESAADVAQEIGRVDLSRLACRSAKVGWHRATRDRIPTSAGEPDELFLELDDGSFYPRGLYAHAPSRYVFGISGKWKRMTAIAGIQRGHDASVVFVVTGDGKELFRSKTIGSPGSVSIDVDVSGVDTLELIVEPTTDGNANDWGLWLSPELTR